MKKFAEVFFLFAALVLLFSLSALAGEPARTGQASIFQKIDVKGDGMITAEEFQDYFDSVFTKMDSNKSGALNFYEILALETKNFKDPVTGKNKPISRKEFLIIAVGDPAPASKTVKKAILKNAAAGIGDAFKVIDANRDSKIDKKEFAAFAELQFERIDISKDGSITLDEFTSYEKGEFKGIDKDNSGTVFREEYRNFWSVPLLKF
jgi:Ca2+-binding EF-hand superfamily protein